jgi:flagellar export protein FliJ
MAFRFSLASVLRFRESLERRDELALQKVQMQIAQTRLALEELSAQIAQAQQARDQAMREPVPGAHLQMMVRAAEAAAQQKRVLILNLDTLEKLREERIQAYQAAHRQRQMLSDVETRQRDAYENQRARQQQKFLDDVYVARLQRD